ncbi:S24 family peptidase [Thermus sp.]|uniref:S24 family peptidase n=1 Tax=Thermus sp. TaxID=275 RepID=UPI0025D01B2E|nr:S24 family peptidase [Thermus sp.]MCS6867785.1 S24 family peptidase [Thermus sp.]MDW8358849.1 S24 family peptidase [Thermus sp.]
MAKGRQKGTPAEGAWPRSILIPREFYRPNGGAFLVHGHCMAPRIPEGSYVLVDFGDTLSREGEVYVLDTPEGRQLKRAVRREEGLRFELDRPGTHPGFSLEEVRVVGRVYAVMTFFLEDRPRRRGKKREATSSRKLERPAPGYREPGPTPMG